MKTTKPRDQGLLAQGLKRGTGCVMNCSNPTTSPFKIQLFGTFCSDTKNAVILLAGEVSYGR
jgi:hypothetical protein